MSAVIALRAPSGVALSALGAGLRAEIATLAVAPEVVRAVVSIADVDPGAARWVRLGEVQEAPAFDVLIGLTARAETFTAVIDTAMAAVRPFGEAVHAWQVTRLPARTEREPPEPGTGSPGIKYVVLCTFHPDLPDSAVRRSWDHHVPLALRIHEGAARYVRSWIDAPLTANAPPFQGIT